MSRCSDALNDGDGMIKIKIIEQKTGPLYKEDLNSDVIFFKYIFIYVKILNKKLKLRFT